MNVNLKKEDNVNIVVMEEDVDDDEDEADFLGGRRIEERMPVEVRRIHFRPLNLFCLTILLDEARASSRRRRPQSAPGKEP